MTDKKNELQSPLTLQLYISIPMSTDSEVIEKLCSMDDLDRVFYMNTFKSDSRTLEDNVAKEILEISNRELDCVVLESMLVDVDEINKQECTLVLEFYVDIEYHLDESESIEPNQAQIDLENILRKGCPASWTIN